MNTLKLIAVGALVALVSFSSGAHGQTILTNGDTKILQTSPDQNFGFKGWLHVNNRTDALFSFDVSGISGPVTAQLQLELVPEGFRTAGPVAAYELAGPWNENAVTWATQPPVGERITVEQIPATAAGQIVSFDVSSLVNEWIDNPSNNFGLMLRADSSATNIVFRSRESQNGQFPARLIIGTMAPMVTRITVLDGSIVLGDPPRNTFWETEIDIDQTTLLAAKSAHVGLYTVNNELGRVVINGEVVQLPYVLLNNQYSRWRPELGQTLLSIPLGYLHSGKNIIRFESGIGNFATTNIYDDYSFGDVEIILSLH